MKSIVALLAAAGMAVAPVAASAQDASALSLSRAWGPTVSGLSFLQDEDSEHHGGNTAVILGVLLVVLIGVAAISGNSSQVSNSP